MIWILSALAWTVVLAVIGIALVIAYAFASIVAYIFKAKVYGTDPEGNFLDEKSRD